MEIEKLTVEISFEFLLYYKQGVANSKWSVDCIYIFLSKILIFWNILWQKLCKNTQNLENSWILILFWAAEMYFRSVCWPPMISSTKKLFIYWQLWPLALFTGQICNSAKILPICKVFPITISYQNDSFILHSTVNMKCRNPYKLFGFHSQD
jgi:hypothetical protein